MATDDVSMDPMDLEGDDEGVNPAAHEKLLNSLFALDGKKRFKQETVRGVPTASQNLNLVVHAKNDESKIQAKDLNIKRSRKGELKKPVNAFETEKARREIARETVKAEMTKWEPVVHEIRSAPQMICTSRPTGVELKNALKPNRFTPRTPLEMELFAALGQSENRLSANKELTVAEERALKAMSLSEARARRAELMKHHDLLSRMQIKAKRIKKIKSKRYRKFARKEKDAATKKELEMLQKNDPEAFIEKMEQMEEARIEERLTLKHRGGGKFSRMHKVYSKFDDKTRNAMQEMLQKSRELTKKRNVEESSDDEDDGDNATSTVDTNASANVAIDDDGEDDEAKKASKRAKQLEILKAINKKAGGWLDGPRDTSYVYQKPQDELIKETPESGTVRDSSSATGEETADVSKAVEDAGESVEPPAPASQGKLDGSSKNEPAEGENKGNRKRSLSHKEDEVEEDEEEVGEKEEGDKNKTEVNDKGPAKKKRKKNQKGKNATGSATASEASSAEKTVKETTLHVEDIDSDGDDAGAVSQGDQDDEEDNDGSAMKVTMEELFEDEDLVEAFAKEKAEAEEKDRPKIEDTKLPGWGKWAGPDFKDVKPSARQQKQAKRKAALLEKKKQKNAKQHYVWVNPKQDESMRQLQPKRVPFPYASVQQYEASLRQPVSRGFVRETAMKMLTKPEVVAKQGHIIKPLDKEDYFSKKNDEDENPEDNKRRQSGTGRRHRRRIRRRKKTTSDQKNDNSASSAAEEKGIKKVKKSDLNATKKKGSDKIKKSDLKVAQGKERRKITMSDLKAAAPKVTDVLSNQNKVLSSMKEKAKTKVPRRRMVT